MAREHVLAAAAGGGDGGGDGIIVAVDRRDRLQYTTLARSVRSARSSGSLVYAHAHAHAHVRTRLAIVFGVYIYVRDMVDIARRRPEAAAQASR